MLIHYKAKEGTVDELQVRDCSTVHPVVRMT